MSQARYCEARLIGSRLCLRGAIELLHPCHLGGADPDASSDRPLLRDGAGRPFLAATALKGLLRSALEELGGKGAERAALLCGGSAADPTGVQARLLVDDAAVLWPGVVPTELRDGVAIDPRLALAADHQKFDLELLPAGTRLCLSFELLLFGTPAEPTEQDEQLLEGLLELLALLEQGRISLGARTRRGFGQAEAKAADGAAGCWHLQEYRVSTAAGLQAWLGRALAAEGALPAGWPGPTAEGWFDTAALAAHLCRACPAVPAESGFRIRLELAVQGSLLLRSGGFEAGSADQVQLSRLQLDKEGSICSMPVLSGTSLAGALRHRCLRIARTLEGRPDGDKALQLVAGMFGPAKIERSKNRGRPGEARASRLYVAEAALQGGRTLRHTRVRIDPWTGGAAESLLFSEDAQYGGALQLDLVLRPPAAVTKAAMAEVASRAAAERGLLLLALRDLAGGELRLGGEGAIGRGCFGPAGAGGLFATVLSGPGARLLLRADGTVQSDPPGAFDQDLVQLRRWLCGGEQR